MKASFLNRLVFSPGQILGQEDSVIIPLLKELNIPHAISIGPKALNMAEAFEKSVEALISREEEFLIKNRLHGLKNAIISGVPSPDQLRITSVTPEDSHRLKSGTKIQTDCLFTTSSEIVLIHKPADCPTAIIKATRKDGSDILGLIHLGRPQVNDHRTEQALDYLIQAYRCKPNDVFIGISPSIGPNYYWIKQVDQDEKIIIDRAYWGAFAYDDEVNKVKIIRIDVLKKILSIFTAYGVPAENIQAYGHDDMVDTYTLAALTTPLSFSHRFASNTEQSERNGRIMVAAQLPL